MYNNDTKFSERDRWDTRWDRHVTGELDDTYNVYQAVLPGNQKPMFERIFRSYESRLWSQYMSKWDYLRPRSWENYNQIQYLKPKNHKDLEFHYPPKPPWMATRRLDEHCWSELLYQFNWKKAQILQPLMTHFTTFRIVLNDLLFGPSFASRNQAAMQEWLKDTRTIFAPCAPKPNARIHTRFHEDENSLLRTTTIVIDDDNNDNTEIETICRSDDDNTEIETICRSDDGDLESLFRTRAMDYLIICLSQQQSIDIEQFHQLTGHHRAHEVKNFYDDTIIQGPTVEQDQPMALDSFERALEREMYQRRPKCSSDSGVFET